MACHASGRTALATIILATVGLLVTPGRASAAGAGASTAATPLAAAFTVAITSQPKPVQDSGSATFNWSASQPLSASTCTLDKGAPEACQALTSEKYSKLANGPHTFQVVVVSTGGETAQATYEWKVGPAPSGPLVALTAEPADQTQATSATFAWTTVGNVASTTCSVDGADATDCSQPFVLEPVATGSHSFKVTVKNKNGAKDSASWSWEVTGATSVTITSAPPAQTTDTTATFVYTTSGDVTQERCKLDGQSAKSCVSPVQYSALAVGSHTFTVTVTGAAGATASDSRTWTVQAAQPANSFYVSPSGNDNNDGSQNAPWKTLQKAADSVPAGGTVIIAGGTYAGFVMRRSGTSTAPITFTSASGQTATIDGNANPQKQSPVDLETVSWITLENLTVVNAHVMYSAGILVVKSSNIKILDNVVTRNDSYDIRLYNSNSTLIEGNDITHSGAGVEVHYQGDGVLITHNAIHDNDRMVVNDTTNSNNDNGGNAIQLFKTTGPLTVSGNEMYNNRADSYDYGKDGGAVEIYGASNSTITDNVMWNNENISETGTDSNVQCQNNVFDHNVAFGGPGHPYGHAVGLYMRCGQNMLIAYNTLDGIDYWQIVIELSSGYSASVAGMQVLNNVMSQDADKIYALGSGLPSDIRIDYNLTWKFKPGGVYASVKGKGDATSIDQFRQWTGHDANTIFADPLFVDRAANDYHLQAGSPAIDSALPLRGVSTQTVGAGPDRGAYEFGGTR
jgi:hypothetical protein